MFLKNLSHLKITKNQIVILRVDFNVPIEKNKIISDERIKASIPTIKYILAKEAKIIIISHLGRPIAGKFAEEFSLKPISKHLANLLNKDGAKVVFCPKYQIDDLNLEVYFNEANVVLLENIRFFVGEKDNCLILAKRLAKLGSIFVMDAFATAHRITSSTVGISNFIDKSCAGLLLEQEINILDKISSHPKKPLLTIVGGAKTSTKIPILNAIADISDCLIVGGGIANTFLVAAGFKVGLSLYEKNLLGVAKKIATKTRILLPIDVTVATEFSARAKTLTKDIEDIKDNEIILDIGPKTLLLYKEELIKAASIIMNGPVGVFEFVNACSGTKGLLQLISNLTAFKSAGGGDTIAAINKFGFKDSFDYISTGGGAFLEYIQGKKLPAIEALKETFVGLKKS